MHGQVLTLAHQRHQIVRRCQRNFAFPRQTSGSGLLHGVVEKPHCGVTFKNEGRRCLAGHIEQVPDEVLLREQLAAERKSAPSSFASTAAANPKAASAVRAFWSTCGLESAAPFRGSAIGAGPSGIRR